VFHFQHFRETQKTESLGNRLQPRLWLGLYAYALSTSQATQITQCESL